MVTSNAMLEGNPWNKCFKHQQLDRMKCLAEPNSRGELNASNGIYKQCCNFQLLLMEWGGSTILCICIWWLIIIIIVRCVEKSNHGYLNNCSICGKDLVRSWQEVISYFEFCDSWQTELLELKNMYYRVRQTTKAIINMLNQAIRKLNEKES